LVNPVVFAFSSYRVSISFFFSASTLSTRSFISLISASFSLTLAAEIGSSPAS
jgi:hypothetical protein